MTSAKREPLPQLERGDVVYVVPSFPADMSKPGHVARQLATRVAARRRVLVLTSEDEPLQGAAGSPPAMTVRHLWTRRLAGVPLAPGLIRDLLATPRSAIIHVHVTEPFVTEVVWLVAKMTRRRFVAHFLYDVEPSSRLGPLFLLWKKHILSRVMRSASRVVVPNHEQAVLAEELYGIPAKRISVIPRPVSAELLAVAERPDLEVGPIRIVYTGQLAGSGETPGVLDVVSSVHSPIEMAVITDSSDTAEIEARVRLTDVEAVQVVGTSADGGDEKWFTWADVLVVVDETPETEVVVRQALFAGLPIVAADGPLVRSVAAAAPLYVEPSASAFSEAIDRVASEADLRQEMKRCSWRRADALEWDRVADAMDDLYRRIAG